MDNKIFFLGEVEWYQVEENKESYVRIKNIPVPKTYCRVLWTLTTLLFNHWTNPCISGNSKITGLDWDFLN